MATEYVILQRIPEGWSVVRNAGGPEIRASASPKAAIRALIGSDREGGEFVAIPVRSWKPVTVKVETKTALKFS